MARIVVDRFKALPPVCLMTGETEDVSFERVKLKSNDEVKVLKCLLLSLCTLHVWKPELKSETFELSLPFSPQGLARFNRARTVVVSCLVAAILSLAGLALVCLLLSRSAELKKGEEWKTTVPLLAGTIALVGTSMLIATREHKNLPIVTSFDDRKIALELPSADAARAFNEVRAEKRAERDEALAEKREKKTTRRRKA